MTDIYHYNASYSDEEALKKAIALSRREQKKEALSDTLSRNAPSHLCCPFTKRLFRDPVQVIHGNTYERQAILQWFSISKTEPVSGEKLFITVLFENDDILAECTIYIEQEHSCHHFQKPKTRKRRVSYNRSSLN